VLSYLASPALPVRVAAASTLNALMRYCVTNEEIIYAAAHVNAEKQDPRSHPLLPISESLLSALKNIKYQAGAMPHLLSVVAAFISRLRFRINGNNGNLVPAASILTHDHVKTAGQLRGVDNFEFREGAELVLGTATEVCGPEWVLSLLPLNLDDTQKQTASEPGRAWLLPIFKSKITNTRLSHFTTYFVPLSEAMFGKLKQAEAKAESASTEADKKRLGIQAKVFEALVQQIWALFSGYCDLPVDLPQVCEPRLGIW
jgi:ribosomal RNA-processing protein 12